MGGKQEGGGGKGRMEGKQERERCDPYSGAVIIFRRKCPNWQAAGRATALLWFPTPCPSPPQPSLLLGFLLPPHPRVLFHLLELVFSKTSCLLLYCPSLLLFYISASTFAFTNYLFESFHFHALSRFHIFNFFATLPSFFKL